MKISVQHLVAGPTAQRTAGVGLVIEAPPETASTLTALFSGMAQIGRNVEGHGGTIPLSGPLERQ